MALTGLFAAGVCNADAAHALAAFSAQYPQMHNGQIISAVGLQFVAPDHVAGSLVLQNLLTGAYTWTWLDIPLVACDPLISPVTFSNVFSVPPSPDVATAWMLGFTLPLILWLTAWGFGTVINMFKHEND